MKKIPEVFSITPYGSLQKVTEIISKARVRIFYIGLNRNLTYITDEFAKKLLQSLPGVPVGGLWDDEKKDFTDHGTGNREEFRAFGFVPENPNISWEGFVDKDGIERTYACCDVYLWTDRWQAAREIVGKAQSMELLLRSIKGSWIQKDGIEFYKYTDGAFSGLTALGENVEPCFEGSAFYSLNKQDVHELKEMIKELRSYTLSLKTDFNKGGNDMHIDNNEPVVKPAVEPVVEPVVEPTTEPTEPVVEPTEPTEPTEPVVEPTEPVVEPTEPVVEPTEPVVEPTEPVVEPVVEPTEPITDYEAAIADLTEKLTNSATLYANAQSEIESLKEENSQLKEFKNSVESKEKETMIENYSKVLSETQKSELLEKISTYSIEELKTKIALVLFEKANKSTEPEVSVIFTNVDTDDTKLSGAARLMKKHCK